MTAITSSRDNDLNDKGSSRELLPFRGPPRAETRIPRLLPRQLASSGYSSIDTPRDILIASSDGYPEGWLASGFSPVFYRVIFRGVIKR